MPPKTPFRRALAPLLTAGLLTTSALAAATPAAALDINPHELAADLVGSAGAAEAAPPAEPKRSTTQPVVPGEKLKAKPPPWVLPVAGYHLTGRFGASSGLWASTHTGLDFAADEGTEIRSIGPGVVVSAGYDGAYGNKTVVRLDDGTVLWYCHQSEFAVDPGQRLAPGDLVGYVGSTGNTTGPHLHLEVHPGGGAPIDPEAWLPEHHLNP
jgi:murein DD-endopeptidase MepM/ murein hydrolase activator NlpD